MTTASDYNYPVQVQTYSQPRNAVNGQQEPVYTPGATLRGTVDLASSSITNEFGSRQTTTQGTIRFRGYPAIAPNDRLLNLRWNETYLITGLHRGKLEIICEVDHLAGNQNPRDI